MAGRRRGFSSMRSSNQPRKPTTKPTPSTAFVNDRYVPRLINRIVLASKRTTRSSNAWSIPVCSGRGVPRL